jgi:ribonuclease Z
VPDTRPCEGSLWLAQGVDLLVHEGTYSHSLVEDARERAHSTVRQAAETARQAGAARLIVTHISPKHDDPRPLLEEAREVFDATTIARDLLSVEVESREHRTLDAAPSRLAQELLP